MTIGLHRAYDECKLFGPISFLQSKFYDIALVLIEKLYLCALEEVKLKQIEIMRKILMFVVLGALAFTACNNEPTNEFSATIKPESTLVEFGKSGGEKTVKFAIINPVGGSVTAEDNADWIEAVVEFNSELIITAEANAGDAREAKVTLKYSSAKSVDIVVKQRSGLTGDYDVEYVAEHFEGQYFGKGESATYNYFVILCVKESVLIVTFYVSYSKGLGFLTLFCVVAIFLI